MAQELTDKIRAAAQAKGIDPELAVRIAQAESSLKPSSSGKTSSAAGLFGVIDASWKQYGGAPGKKLDADENIRVGTEIISSNTNYLKKVLNRAPRPAEIYAAHHFGPAGAKNFLSAQPGTPMESIFSEKVIKANPHLKGKTSDQVLASLEKKMGSPRVAPAVSRETPSPTPAEQMMEPALRSGMTAQAPAGKMAADLGPGYQAALALSFLSDTDDREDRDTEKEPGIAEQWLAQTESRPAALAEVAEISVKSPFPETQQPRMFNEGGEVEALQGAARKGEAYQALEKYLQARDAMPDVKLSTNLPEGTSGLFTSDNLNLGSGTIKIYKDTPKVTAPSTLTHEMTHAADRQMRQQAIEQGMFGKNNQYTEAYEKLVGQEGRNRSELARMLKPEWEQANRYYRASPKEIVAHGVGAFAGPTLQDRGPRHVDATAATELRILMDLAQRNVDKGPKGLEKIPAFFRKMGRYADGGEVEERLTPQQIERIAAQEAAEREIASKPAFVTPKSGKGRQISTKPGELEMAALQGVSEMPYLLAGAPVDLATMAMRPFGYSVEKPMGGSEDLKQRALDAGIRKAPPEGAAARALYELTQAGASAVNPAAPVRGAMKAAEKTGEAAKMLAGDFMQYNRQLSVPGASYAVRNRGTPFMMSYGNDLTVGPEGKFVSVDQPERYVKGEVAVTMDDKLNEWLSNRVPAYLRRDFASPDDQFVKAADANQLLHFVNKPMKRQDLDPYYDREGNISGMDSLPYVRQTEGFSPQGTAKTEYGKRVEDLTDVSAWPVQLEDISSPGLIPPSMREMAQTNPSTRLTELGTNIDEALQLPELAADMAKMRRMPNTFSVYSQPPVKVPEEYLLTDEALGGLTLAQASNRVARFRKWEEEARQGMASKALFKDPSINRTPAENGSVWVNPDDLAENPSMLQLVQDVGCDGGWCTKAESSALNYGSGENRLSILMDNKARPQAQITITSRQYGPDDFISSLTDNEVATFRAKYPDIAAYQTEAITRTPEFQQWKARNPDGLSITEIKGTNNQTDLTGAPYLKQIQQRIKELDAANELESVDNLDGIGMTMLPFSSDGLLTAGLSFPDRALLTKKFGLEMAGLQAVRTEALRLNKWSQYLVGNEDDLASLINQAARNVLAPQQRATGGMVERRADTRKYL